MGRHTPLAPGVWRVELEGGQTVVQKSVPRQSAPGWRPGLPWAELETLDILTAAGCPHAPRLLAADLEAGALVMEWVPGFAISACPVDERDRAFACLVDAVEAVEAVLDEHTGELEPYTVAYRPKERAALAANVERYLEPAAARAWRDLTREVLAREVRPHAGSVDLRPENALYDGGRVRLIDFASVGMEETERRLVAYSHSLRPPATVLTERGYSFYDARKGTAAALKLAFYDFVYLAGAMDRLAEVKAKGDEVPGMEPAERRGRLAALWRGSRISDPRVDIVRTGLVEGRIP